jgi:hypothetical protein
MYSLSPNTFLVLGEGTRVRGKNRLIYENHVRVEKCLKDKNRTVATRQQIAPSPDLSSKSPKSGRFGEEEKNWSER